MTKKLALELAPTRVNLITPPTGPLVGDTDGAALAVDLMASTAMTGATSVSLEETLGAACWTKYPGADQGR